jgi:uncharacterized protein (TIGR02001 family)
MQECNSALPEMTGAGFVADGPSNRSYIYELVLHAARICPSSTHAGTGTAMWVRTLSLAAAAVLALLGLACGGSGPAASKDRDTEDKGAADAVATTVDASVLSDYRYRGISLSRLGPSTSSSLEVERDGLYVGGMVYTVRLPGNPVAELTGSAGIRRPFAGIDFDLWAEAYYYPAEAPAPGDGATNYWQANLKSSRKFDGFELIGQFGYSPTVWNSGAWGVYGSGMLNIDMPKFKLASEDITWKLVGELGYQSFGTTSLGTQLPDYAHWRLGFAFAYDKWTLEVNYQDTNLSKESCFVLTGDTSSGGSLAALSDSGRRRFVENTEGLRSDLCGRALVGVLSFEFSPPKR